MESEMIHSQKFLDQVEEETIYFFFSEVSQFPKCQISWLSILTVELAPEILSKRWYKLEKI